MSSLGTRIGELRRRKNITQDQLAEIIGVSSQAVSKWENDISCPDISALPTLADYFSVSIDMLLRGEENTRVQVLEPQQRKPAELLVLKMVVHSSEGDVINMNLPLSLIKASLEIGLPFMQMKNNVSLNNSIRDINFDAIFKLAESGVIGRIMDVRSAEGDIVEIYVD